MTKSQIQQMSQGMSDLYTGLETDLISNIADYLKSGDIYSSTAQWKIQMLAQLGALDKANIKTISNYAGMSPSLLSQALEMASLTAINELEGGFRQLVKDGIINGTNVPVMDTMERTLKLYNKQAKNSLNMVNTVMLYKAKSITGKIINQTAEIANKPEYIAMLSKATGKVITGIESRQSAMRQCIQEMTAKGIPAFVDKLGREWSPEAYINMNIRTTLSNTANTAQMERMSDYGISLVEVSSHSGARPKCAKYQGRIFDKSNKSQKYPHWKDTSYGQPDGLLGINCGHQIYPYIEGVSVQRYFPYNKDTNDKAYRLSQHQRELERRVRKSKRECMVLEKLGDDKGLKRASATLKNRKQALEKFSAANNLPVRTDRTAVVGYNKSISAKVRNSNSDSDFSKKLRRNAKSKLTNNEIMAFEQLPENLKSSFKNGLKQSEEKTAKILTAVCEDADFALQDSKSFYNPIGNIISLRKDCPAGTIAHETFHYIDHRYKVNKKHNLFTSLQKDWANILKASHGDVVGYFQEKYPYAFKQSHTNKLVFKSEYRGISDIISGLSKDQINFGFHHIKEYWEKSGKLQAESWAQFGRIYYENNPEARKMFSELFTNYEKDAIICLEEVFSHVGR